MSLLIQTQRTILRDLTEKDYEFFSNLETREHSLRYESDTIPTKKYLDKKFKDILSSSHEKSRTKYILLIERKEDHLLLGKVLLWQIDKAIAEWEMGWVTHPNYLGKGYASEAARALLEFGFVQLGANRICANCNDANLSSERVMQKIGMHKEGILRETRKLNGKWYGSCIYSILKREFDNWGST